MRGGDGAHSGRVYLLVSSPDAVGGIVRSAHNLANHLAGRYDVEVIGLRHREHERAYPLDPRVKVSYIVDGSPRGKRLEERPSKLHPQARRDGHTALTDLLLRRRLGALPPGIIVSTRPMLHLAATRFARPGHVLVGQEHLNFPRRQQLGLVSALGEAMSGLDRFVVLTQADARDYRAAFPGTASKVRVIHNSSPWPPVPARAATGTSGPKTVVAGGRLTGQKGFDRLIAAYAPIARRRPDWQLHIYGEGPSRARLERLVTRLGVGEHVILKGHVPDFDRVLENASLYAMTSRFEGFPMVLVEAMSKGLPAVSFDCPRGPGEIIADGENGRLVPDGDVRGFTRTLLRLIDHPARRSRMAANALQTAAQYRSEPIMAQWEDLFEELRQVSHRPGPSPSVPVMAPAH